MQKVLDFFKSKKSVLIWTVLYIFTMWAVLHFLFNFNMFSGAHWHRLARAELQGFPGFVFGILILAALPLYIATTTLVNRTGELLIKIPIPKIKVPKFMLPTPADTTDSPTDTPVAVTEPAHPESDSDSEPAPLPEDMPAEMRGILMRTRQHLGLHPASAFDLSHMTTPDNTTPNPQATDTQTQDEIPLPLDFDFDPSTVTAQPDSYAAPTFTEINFDAPATDIPAPEIPDQDTLDFQPDLSPLTDYLTQQNTAFQVTDNIVITDKLAIATHNDPDFWVPDTQNWFAAGRVCPSPIAQVTDQANAHGLKPVIYLATTNIMELESNINIWRDMGITVITDLTELTDL